MKRQILIRGAAIAFAGVAASVFAAQQFMGQSPQRAQVASPGAAEQVRSASLVGASNPPATANTAVPELTHNALDASAAPLAELTLDSPDARSRNQMVPSQSVASLDSVLAPASSDALADDFQPPMTLAQAAPQANDASCAPSLTIETAIDALVDLRLTAPCAPNARIVVSHNDLAFSAFTDAGGNFAAYIPALSQTATIEVFMPDQTVLQAQAVVPDAMQHVRLMVQWTGGEGVLLHAYHRGAIFGEAGHIHASRPFDAELDAAFVLSLGEARGPEPMLSQIYSIPADMLDQTRVELEVSLTQQNCGKDVTAFVSQQGKGMSGELRELTIAMPDCGSKYGLVIFPLALTNVVLPQADMGTQEQVVLQN